MENYQFELKSHPNRLLKDHLIEVSSLFEKLFNDIGLEDDDLKIALKIACFFHDIGKSTQYFQDYLLKKSKKGDLSNHAFIGALASYILCDKYLNNNELYKIIAYLIVKRHHGNIKNNIRDEFDLNKDIEKLNTIQKQIISIDKGEIVKIISYFIDDLNISFQIEEIIDLFKNKEEYFIKSRSYLRKKQQNLSNYIIILLSFSLLLDSDKSATVIKDTDILFNYKKYDLKEKIVLDYIDKLPNKNNIRNRAIEYIKNYTIDLNEKIYSITLPTGMGKTLISFLFAIRIMNEFKNKNNKELRLVYSLPFLSIIEQNHNVIENVLKTNYDINSDLLLKYHHLSKILYKTDKAENDNEYDYNESRILIEGFNSKIIITTFIQFFNSIISNKNKMIRKFHKLTNSIIILDEIQSIPNKYWLLINNILKELSNKFNFYIILSTATKPLIFRENEIKEIYDKEYFNFFNRYDVIVDINKKKTIDEFINTIEFEKDKSYLFILNTIKSAKELFTKIKEVVEEDFELEYLSTHIVPQERLKRINNIKNSKSKNKILVSTQLIEAGVDIDFNIIYRDLAPLDSIIQSAGRCNREAIIEKGHVFIINLADENNKSYSSKIYDDLLINKTIEVLKNHTSFEEKEVINIVEDYYKKVSNSMSEKESIDLLDSLRNLDFSKIDEFKLIKEQDYKSDIFVEFDDNAEQILNKFKEIMENKEFDNFKKKEEFDKIKHEFNKYIISVNVKDNQPFEFNKYLYYIPKNNINDYYNLKTGYITENIGSLIW